MSAIDPGEGWRLLELGEVVLAGDQMLRADKRWEKMPDAWSGKCVWTHGHPPYRRLHPPSPVVPVPKWTGDLADDCSLRVGLLLAHAECLGERNWFLAVYRGDNVLFHSGEHAGTITSGDMARALGEAIVRVAQTAPTPEASPR